MLILTIIIDFSNILNNEYSTAEYWTGDNVMKMEQWPSNK